MNVRFCILIFCIRFPIESRGVLDFNEIDRTQTVNVHSKISVNTVKVLPCFTDWNRVFSLAGAFVNTVNKLGKRVQ